MAFSRYDPRSRYRLKSQQRMVAMLGFLIVGSITAVLGVVTGYQMARMDRTELQNDIHAIVAERDRLRETAMKLMADTHSASVRYQQIEEQMQSEIPQDGPVKDIVQQIKAQLEAGVAPDRLASVIRTLSPPRNCTDPETKRFVVQTPMAKKAGGSVLISDGLITVKALGNSSKNKNGGDEAWFDPAQTVTTTFSWKEGSEEKTLDKAGLLPLSQVLVLGKREYRITLSEGARSFVKVTYDSCDYP